MATGSSNKIKKDKKGVDNDSNTYYIKNINSKRVVYTLFENLVNTVFTQVYWVVALSSN